MKINTLGSSKNLLIMPFNNIASIIKFYSSKNQLTYPSLHKIALTADNHQRVVGLFNSTLFIGIYGMVTQPQNFKKGKNVLSL